jgi:predicted NAD/FAD-dependent oxidoreductase
MIMDEKFCRAAALIGIVLASSAAALPAGAKSLGATTETSIQAATQAEQKALDDVVRAETALSHAHRYAALDDVEKAQVTLLNAQGAREYKAPGTLAALTKAHGALLSNDASAATGDLATAEAAFTTPHTS